MKKTKTKPQTLEQKIAKGKKSKNPETAAYWAARELPAYTRKKRVIQFAAAQRVQVLSSPHTDFRNGKPLRSGGQGPATLSYNA